MKFVKMHGTGNDFVLIDARDMEQDWPSLAQAMCRRHFGVGADGLLLVKPSKAADFFMRVFNPDGSEAEACGNGIRCFAKYVADSGLATPRDNTLKVETLAGVSKLTLEIKDGLVSRVKVGMGKPRFKPEEIPVIAHDSPVLNLPLKIKEREIKVTCVSMGNPHAVAFLDEPVGGYPMGEIGPLMEYHPIFPKRVNFEIANVIDMAHINARVWERGVGETLACGSGACAIMVAARLHGRVDDRVDITLPGGTLQIEWYGQGEVYLTGPAKTVFTGEWEN